MSKIRLRDYDNSWYRPGRSALWRGLWFFVGLPILRSHLIPSSGLRVWLLRRFGARIGTGVVIRMGVNVKYPWHLQIGDETWVGEDCWIDNLTSVRIGSNCCISQGAYLCTGNHDWSDPNFGLVLAPIEMADGSWAGARSLLAPGATLGEGAVAAAASLITGHVPPFEIFAGNPAVFVKKRRLRQKAQAATADPASERHATA